MNEENRLLDELFDEWFKRWHRRPLFEDDDGHISCDIRAAFEAGLKAGKPI